MASTGAAWCAWVDVWSLRLSFIKGAARSVLFTPLPPPLCAVALEVEGVEGCEGGGVEEGGEGGGMMVWWVRWVVMGVRDL